MRRVTHGMILAAKGRLFSGTRLAEMANQDLESVRNSSGVHDNDQTLHRSPAVVARSGFATGGGCQLVATPIWPRSHDATFALRWEGRSFARRPWSRGPFDRTKASARDGMTGDAIDARTASHGD